MFNADKANYTQKKRVRQEPSIQTILEFSYKFVYMFLDRRHIQLDNYSSR